MDYKQSSVVKQMLKKVEGKGFYIILSLCVLAIGVTGYVLFFTNTVTNDDFDAAIDIDSILDPIEFDEPVVGDEGDENTDLPDEPVISNPDEIQEPDKPTEDDTTKPTVQVTKAVAPTGGQIIRGFSGDKLEYDKTMADWRTHNGTDFSCTQGDTVFCVRDGTVTNVFEDGLLGHSVSVEHSGGIISTYSGLSPAAAVKKGDKLKMGDAVGTAGGTAIGESAQEYHIHVTVTKDGKYIDVMSLF